MAYLTFEIIHKYTQFLVSMFHKYIYVATRVSFITLSAKCVSDKRNTWLNINIFVIHSNQELFVFLSKYNIYREASVKTIKMI